MNNTDGPSARRNSAYGFSANERADITRGMYDGEEPSPMAITILESQPDPAAEWEVRRHQVLEILKLARTELAAANAPRATDEFRAWATMTGLENIVHAIQVLEGKAPPTLFPSEDDGHPLPKDQLDYCSWVAANFKTVFHAQVDPTGLKPIATRQHIKGLVIYAAEGFGGQFHAAWTVAGKFVAWMHFCPSLSHIDHDFSMGEILGGAIWPDNHMNAIRRKPLTTWYSALRLVAVKLGVS